MKRTNTNEMQDPELVEFIGERRQELFNLRFQHATGQLENTARLRDAKRELARGLTVAHARQIEAARIAMTRAIKRGGKVWINIFPDKPVTKKPAETRMGSGKGNPEFWVAVVRPGRVLFELSYPNEEIARAAMFKAIQKLPIKARIITREEVY